MWFIQLAYRGNLEFKLNHKNFIKCTIKFLKKVVLQIYHKFNYHYLIRFSLLIYLISISIIMLLEEYMNKSILKIFIAVFAFILLNNCSVGDYTDLWPMESEENTEVVIREIPSESFDPEDTRRN